MEFYERNVDALGEEYARDRKEASQSYGNVPLVFLKKGITVVRVMPPFSEEGVWFREIMEHNLKVNGKWTTVTCARCAVPAGPCPLCDTGEILFKSGDEDKVQIADDLKPRRQYLFNVIVMSNPDGLSPDKGIHVMKAGKMVKTQILDLDMDSACCGDVTSIENGINLRIERRGEGLNTEYVVRNVKDRTDIAADLAQRGIDINTLQLFNLNELFPPREYDVVEKMVDNVNSVPGFPPGQAPRPAPATVTARPVVVPPLPTAKPVAKPAGVFSVPKPLTVVPMKPKLVPTAAPVLPDPPQE